ncbi:MAG: hypothetical protein RBS80_32165, partial [Thermoguttaceae bacterium]|nr:hypothetical protein [Thermoguttaceae bacterium]
MISRMTYLLRPFASLRIMLVLGFSGATLGWSLPCPAVEADVLLRGGMLFDGTGAEGQAGDVAIRGDKIVAVGRFDVGRVGRVIDCTGLMVAPGFIDLHTHSDRSIG